MIGASHSDDERPRRLPTGRTGSRPTPGQRPTPGYRPTPEHRPTPGPIRRNIADPDSGITVALHRPWLGDAPGTADHGGHGADDDRPHLLATSPADNLTVPWHRLAAGTVPSGPVPAVAPPTVPVRHRWRRVAGRTLSKAWGDSLFGMSSQAAFWSALSTAPLLLALLGSVGYVANWFGKDTINKVRDQIDIFLHSIFNQEVAQNLVGSTVNTILHNGQADVVSVGFVISLWAGSSAMSAFVESITIAYGQHEARHPVAERFFALGLYLAALVFGVFLLPLLAIGPTTLPALFPKNFQSQVTTIVGIVYYPVLVVGLVLLLATLYKVAPKHRHAWKRGLPGAFLAASFFLVASFGLRLYLSYVYAHGLTYGALAVPITFLLFYYFVAMAIIIGAQFNNALLEYYPPRIPKRQIRRWQRFDPERFDQAGQTFSGE